MNPAQIEVIMNDMSPKGTGWVPVVLASFLFLIFFLPAPMADAKDDSVKGLKVAFDPYPLRPPDTSSPWVTLRSFLTNADKANVGQFLETFKEYPPSLPTKSLKVEQALQALRAGSLGDGK